MITFSKTPLLVKVLKEGVRSFSSGKNVMCFRADGLVVAPITPFTQKGDIVYTDLAKCVQYFQQTHIKSLFVNGTLGEGKAQTTTERKQSAERWMEATDKKMPIILHIGADTLSDTQELARHAEEIGVAAIAALPPTYYKPATEEALVDYMEKVTEAAPNTPFLYYDYNIATGIYLNIPRFLRLAEHRIPTLCGLKHTSPELNSALNCSTVCGGKYQVLYGTLEMYLPALSLGLDPVITIPYVGEIFNDIKQAFVGGDMKTALHHQIRAQSLANIVGSARGGIGGFRAVFELMSGISVGPPRLPLLPLSQEKRQQLEKALRDEGFI